MAADYLHASISPPTCAIARAWSESDDCSRCAPTALALSFLCANRPQLRPQPASRSGRSWSPSPARCTPSCMCCLAQMRHLHARTENRYRMASDGWLVPVSRGAYLYRPAGHPRRIGLTYSWRPCGGSAVQVSGRLAGLRWAAASRTRSADCTFGPKRDDRGCALGGGGRGGEYSSPCIRPSRSARALPD